MKQLALDVATDDELKFDLAIQLKQLDIAKKIAEADDSEHKWKTLADLAFSEWKVFYLHDLF